MKVGIVTKEWPPEIYGGAGVHVKNLTAALEKIGTQIEVHCFGKERADARNYQLSEGDKQLNPAIAALKLNIEIASNLAEVEVVHTHTWYANYAGVLAQKIYKSKSVLTAHSLEPDRPWKEAQLGGGYRVSSFIEKTAYENADGIIAVSKGTKADILRAYPFVDPNKISVIYNGIDSNIYFPQTSFSTLEKYHIQTPYSLFVGRITRQKGLEHLINAWQDVSPEFGLVIAAGAPDEPEIAKRVTDAILHLQKNRKNVIWINQMLPQNELISLYSSAALFICPSIYEPLGIVNLEAMACQTAVLGSRVGGIPEVVADGVTGELVDYSGNASEFENSLAQSINKLMSNPELLEKYGLAGRKRVQNEFSWDQIAHQTLDYYQNLLNQ